MARKIVVTSGKGGVGKTTVAANLAIRLGALGKRALVIDLDTGLNDLDVDTGVENLVVYDLIDCIEGRCRAKQAIIECPQGKNAFVLPCVRNVRAESGFADKLKELYVGLDSSFYFYRFTRGDRRRVQVGYKFFGRGDTCDHAAPRESSRRRQNGGYAKGRGVKAH